MMWSYLESNGGKENEKWTIIIRFEITVAVYNIEYNADHDQLKPKTSV